MIRTTKAQRKALKRVYDRGPIHHTILGVQAKPLTYRQFRQTVECGHDCIMVFWCSMWLGIEPDGYTHS